MKTIINKLKDKFNSALQDDKKRYKAQYLCTYFILGTVSLFMTIVNIVDPTASTGLMIATLVFAVLSYMDVAFVYISEKTYVVSKYLFTGEVIVLFSFFLINGSPEGFSALWALLLPSLGLLLFGKKSGTIINIIMLTIIILLLRTDLGTWLHVYEHYTPSFRLRFPFAYVAFYFVGLLIETIRASTFKNYEYFYSHDNLTGAINRKGFNDFVEKEANKISSDTVGFIMLDIDHFKRINDSYGHRVGDEVLKCISKTISENVNVPLCRWGGEEFVLLFLDGNLDEQKANDIRNLIKNTPVIYEGLTVKVTISVGAVLVDKEKLDNIIDVSNFADECMYEAKNNGRNKTVFKDCRVPKEEK